MKKSWICHKKIVKKSLKMMWKNEPYNQKNFLGLIKGSWNLKRYSGPNGNLKYSLCSEHQMLPFFHYPLSVFMKNVFSTKFDTPYVSQTNNLTEAMTINILVRKLTGTAQILIDDFISQQDKNALKLKQVVAHLERKFLMVSSPYLADIRLHEIKIQDLTFSQLHAQITRSKKIVHF